ncbi:MAG: polyprenyl diphosphate synthase [bacterium]
MTESAIPYHLGIIIDGNRRWAREKGLPAAEGHRAGSKRVRELIFAAKKRGVKILTLFVFSTENWQRPKAEVGFLMRMLGRAFGKKYIKEVISEKIKMNVIGQREKLPKFLQKRIKEVEAKTICCKEMVLNFALSYGGRAEIVEAIKKIIEKKIPLEKINEDVIKENLWTSDVDLIIRTGKAQRISNFLVWQGAYSELYFPQKYWPDFTEKDLDEALADYAGRERRFGK